MKILCEVFTCSSFCISLTGFFHNYSKKDDEVTNRCCTDESQGAEQRRGPCRPLRHPVARFLRAGLRAPGSCRSVPRRVAAGGRVIERVTKVSKVKTDMCRRCDIYGSAGIHAVNWRGHMRSDGPGSLILPCWGLSGAEIKLLCGESFSWITFE